MTFLKKLLLIPCLALLTSSVFAATDSVTRYVRFTYQETEMFGILNDKMITVLEGDIFTNPTVTQEKISLESVQLLPATKASKVIAVGLNFASHNGSTRGAYPRLFSKLPSSLTTDNQPIWLFPDSTNLHFEGELVVVIGKKAHRISPEQASDYIFGVTVGNDITDRTWQAQDLQWMRAKGADSFAPVGPWIVQGVDYSDLLIETRVNDKVMQSESTKNLLFSPAEIVSYASQHATLYPGDMIFTGTPGRTAPLSNGDVVDISIENVGSIRNVVTKK